MRFVDGLCDDIRSMVMIQCPSTLDSACVLALVQEEACDSVKKKYYRCYEPSSNRLAHKSTYPLPPPPKFDKPLTNSAAEDRRPTGVVRSNSVDDKVRALKQYRHARGLCDHCVEKWSYGHQCASTVQLHAIQELWELLPEEGRDTSVVSEDTSAQLCLFLSEDAVAGTESPKSMRLMGQMQGKDVLILVDSGSSNTFISTKLANHLKGISLLLVPLSVRVANGTPVQCLYQLAQAQWEVQGIQFISDCKVLPLQHYDMILGFDWLEQFSPMKFTRWINGFLFLMELLLLLFREYCQNCR